MGAFNTSSSSTIPVNAAPQQATQYAPVSMGASMQQPQGKGGATSSSSSGKGGSSYTFPGQSGQPEMGVPNKYSNTVQAVDNMNLPAVLGASRGKGM